MTRNPRRGPEPTGQFGWEGWALLGLGLLTAVRTKFVGTLYLDDVLFLGLAPALVVTRGGRISWEGLGGLVLIGALWLGNAMITDLIRHTPPGNYERGWAKIICFGASLVSVALLSELKLTRLMAYFLGLAISAMATAFLIPDAYQIGSPWKFGYAPPLSLICVILSSSVIARRSTMVRYLPTIALAAINLLFNFRSMFATLVGTLGVVAISDTFRRFAQEKVRRSPVVALSLVVIAVGGGLAVSTGYGQLASSGFLGPVAQAKYEFQTRAGLGILLGGRSESLISSKAIQDSPIIGHGSWAEDRSYAALYVQTLRDLGVPQQGELASNLIPSHSYFLGSWMEAGIFGGLFWVICFVLAVRTLFVCTVIPATAIPFVSYLTTKLIWDIPFSPFGAATRFTIAGQLCVLFWALRSVQGANPMPGRSELLQRPAAAR